MIKLKNYLNQSRNWVKRSEDFYKIAYLTEFEEIIKNLDNHSKILDVGCGKGELLKVLEDYHKTFNLYGIEIDKTTYNLAKKKLKKTKIINKDALTALKNFENYFDVIFLIDVLEHIDENKIFLFLSLVYKSLKKNGSLVLRVPNAESVFTGSYMRYIDPTHTISFTKESLTAILLDNNFKDIKIRGQRFPNFWFSFLFRLPRFIFENIVKVILFFYYGEIALKSIQTPNLIAIAKK